MAKRPATPARDHATEEYHNNRVAYFDSWVKAWIENRMEKDKQLLTLSALAIGLLVGVLGDLDNRLEFSAWVIAALCFIATAFIILLIFGKNADYIEVLLAEHQGDEDEKLKLGEREKRMTEELNRLTKFAFWLFILGALAAIVLAVMQSGFILVKV